MDGKRKITVKSTFDYKYFHPFPYICFFIRFFLLKLLIIHVTINPAGCFY